MSLGYTVGVKVWLHFLLTSALDEHWYASCPNFITPPQYPLNRRLHGPQSWDLNLDHLASHC